MKTSWTVWWGIQPIKVPLSLNKQNSQSKNVVSIHRQRYHEQYVLVWDVLFKKCALYVSNSPLSVRGVSRRGGLDGGGTVIARGSGVVVGGDEAVKYIFESTFVKIFAQFLLYLENYKRYTYYTNELCHQTLPSDFSPRIYMYHNLPLQYAWSIVSCASCKLGCRPYCPYDTWGSRGSCDHHLLSNNSVRWDVPQWSTLKWRCSREEHRPTDEESTA